MKLKIVIVFLLSLALFSCEKEEAVFRVKVSQNPQRNKQVKVHIDNLNSSDVQQMEILLDDKKFKSGKYESDFNFILDNSFKLGQHRLKFTFKNDDKDIATQVASFELFSDVKPTTYSYKIIKVYPHDIDAFTQGLEFYKDTLYEGTGLNGESSLRKTDYKTGKVLKKIDLDKRYFGEGISVLNDKIYQLTWQNGIGFVYNVSDFSKIKDFPYKRSKEGWGLCNDGKKLYKSDGTEKIWILNPETLEEENYISIYTDKHKIKNINELEWVDGLIYTNVWQKNALAVINPELGNVVAIINLSDLHKQVTQHPKLDVLNGIAYDKKSGHLFVTGKKWDKMFEIEIIKK